MLVWPRDTNEKHFITFTAFNETDFSSYISGVEDVPLNNIIILKVVKHLTTWEELSRYLELSDAEEEEIKSNHPNNYNEQKYRCIKCWEKKNGKTATLICLLRHIYFSLEDKRLVHKVVEDLQQLQSKQTYNVNMDSCDFKSNNKLCKLHRPCVLSKKLHRILLYIYAWTRYHVK